MNNQEGEILELKKIISELTAERDYLLHFYQEADFGPGDGDARDAIRARWLAEGNAIPPGYHEE